MTVSLAEYRKLLPNQQANSGSMKTITVTVRLQVTDDADAHDVVSNCDYSFTHEQIIDTEITGVTDENDQSVFGG